MRYTLYIKRVRVREITLEKEAQTPLKTSLTKKKKELHFSTQFLLHRFILPNGNYRHM